MGIKNNEQTKIRKIKNENIKERYRKLK